MIKCHDWIFARYGTVYSSLCAVCMSRTDLLVRREADCRMHLRLTLQWPTVVTLTNACCTLYKYVTSVWVDDENDGSVITALNDRCGGTSTDRRCIEKWESKATAQSANQLWASGSRTPKWVSGIGNRLCSPGRWKLFRFRILTKGTYVLLLLWWWETKRHALWCILTQKNDNLFIYVECLRKKWASLLDLRTRKSGIRWPLWKFDPVLQRSMGTSVAGCRGGPLRLC